MNKQTRNKRYALAMIFIMMMIGLLTGCGSDDKGSFSLFGAEEVSKPKATDLTSVQDAEKNMASYKRPEAVNKMEKSDPSMINPMYSMSTSWLPDITLLEKNGCFKYDLLKESDFEKLDKITEPTNVSVVTYRDNAYSQWSVQFSCFIYKIDYDYIYLGTAGHCIVKNDDIKRAKVTFYDRTSITVSMEEYKYGNGFRSMEGDYAMYRIPTRSVPADLLKRLKEVNYDEKAIAKVKSGDVLYTGNIYAQNPSKDYDKKLTVLDRNGNVFKYYSSYFSYVASENYFITDAGLVSGQSGSAVFDKYGNLVAITSGVLWSNECSNAGIFTVADKMDDLYNEFIKDDLSK